MNEMQDITPEVPSDKCGTGCSVEQVLRLLSGRWTLYILWRLQDLGPQRFNALSNLIPGVSAKVLTERLKALEAAGLVSRHYEPTVPPKVTYALTARGEELRGTLSHIGEVSQAWVAQGWSAKQGFPNQGTSQDISDP